MVSVNKKKKLTNAYAIGLLKNRNGARLKRLQFFTSSERQGLKDKMKDDDKK